MPSPDDDVPTVTGPRPDIAEAAQAAQAARKSAASGHRKSDPALDEDDDSLTTAVPRRASMPLAIPNKVEIRELVDDPDEATEVRTLAESTDLLPDGDETRALPTLPGSPSADDEPVTAIAQSPLADLMKVPPKSAADPASSMAPTQPEPEPALPHDDPPTRPGNIPGVVIPAGPDAETYDPDDDDITSRTLSLEKVREKAGAEYEDDSVTAQAPHAPHLAGDETDGTTKKRTRPVATRRSPADDEFDSVTTQAPALTERRPSSPDIEDDDLEEIDDDLESKTAVMANAPLLKGTPSSVPRASQKHGTLQGMPSSPPASRSPVTKPPSRPSTAPLPARTAAMPAARIDPSKGKPGSDSGLRVARPEPESGERASFDVVGMAVTPTGPELRPPEMNLAHAPTQLAFPGVSPSQNVSAMPPPQPQQPMMGMLASGPPNPQAPTVQIPPVEAGPKYGLIVAVVAAISVLFPLILFFALRKNEEPAVERGAKTVSSSQTPLSDDVGSKPNKDGTPRPPGSGKHR